MMMRGHYQRTKTKQDWAEDIRTTLENKYPSALKEILICDNLNTHTTGALFVAFPANEALALSKRIKAITLLNMVHG
jgi:hypothetical protein